MSVKENVARAKSDYDRAYDAGKQAEYDAFWDDYQQNGNLNEYSNAFSGKGWTDKNFNPKYNIKTTNAYMMFRSNQVTDLKGILERNGITLDTSTATNFQYCFQWSYITRLPEIDTSGSGQALTSLFSGCPNLVSVDKLILKDDGSARFADTFTNCKSLKELPIVGTIGQNDFDVHWSTNLSKVSIISIVNALSTTTSGLTVTLSKTAVNTAFATTAGGADGSTSAEWLALVATRSNWTIALA